MVRAAASSVRTSAGVPALAILIGSVGVVLAVWGLLSGLGVATIGSGGGAGPFVAMFVAGGVLILGTVVTSIIGLVRPGHRVLWGIALLVGLSPVIGTAVLAIWPA